MQTHLYEWLDLIEARPTMYLREATFTALESFVMGYEMALITHRVNEHEVPPFLEFGSFAVHTLGTPSEHIDPMLGAPAWNLAILAASGSDAEKFRLFFRLLREYRNTSA